MTDQIGDIEEITLADMNVTIDTNQLLTTDFPGRQQLFAIWLVQVNYGRIMSKIGKTEKRAYMQRALDQAKFFSIQQLPGLEDTAAGALTVLINEAQSTGWYTSDFFGYSDIEDFLSNVWEEATEGSSKKSDYTFIVQQLIPAAKEMGIKPGELLAASTQPKKLRQIVPTARQILQSSMDAEKKREGLEWLLGMVADKDISVREVSRQVDEYRGKYTPIPEPMVGRKYMVPGGKTWIVIQCEDGVEERAVEQLLQHRVTMYFTDLSQLFSSVAGMLKVNRELAIGDTSLAKMLQNLEEAM